MTPKLEYSVSNPLNREPPVSELISSFLTRSSNYDRNHGAIPHLSADTHRVHVQLTPSSTSNSTSPPLVLSIRDLATTFPQHAVTCVLACAGNRRHAMRSRVAEVQGIDWKDGAVMNCRWEGPRLRDVLRRAGIEHGDKEEEDGKGKEKRTERGQSKRGRRRHVQFACHQTEAQQDTWYGGSIELDRAMSISAEVVLALKMNGEPLPINKGFPVRVVVPGIIGARSVKWLDRVTVSDEESPCFYQHKDYKILPPEAVDAESAKKYWSLTPPMMDMPVNSVIGSPEASTTVRRNSRGQIEAKGYAIPKGHYGPVVKVEVSADNGTSWTKAKIMEGQDSGKFSWVLWKAEVEVARGKGRRLFSRATDKAGNTQPREPQWNLRGVGYNGWGEVRDLEVV